MDWVALSLMTPLNLGGGAGSWLPGIVVVALGEPGVPVVCCAIAGVPAGHHGCKESQPSEHHDPTDHHGSLLSQLASITEPSLLRRLATRHSPFRCVTYLRTRVCRYWQTCLRMEQGRGPVWVTIRIVVHRAYVSSGQSADITCVWSCQARYGMTMASAVASPISLAVSSATASAAI